MRIHSSTSIGRRNSAQFGVRLECTTTTAQELDEVTAAGRRVSPAFPPDVAESMVDLIMNDLFFQLRLSPTRPLRMPGT